MATEGATAQERPDPFSGGLPISDLFRAIWRRKIWVILPVLILTAITYAVLTRLTPLYSSSAEILVEDTQSVFARSEREGGGSALPDKEAIESHVQLLRSRDLAMEILRELDLTKVAEFDPLSKGMSLPTRLLVLAGIKRDPRLLTPEERALKVYYKRISAYKVGESRVLSVEFESKDPKLAAAIANAIADKYIALQTEAKRLSTLQAADWLGDQIGELRRNVEQAEAKVEAFRADKGLLRGANDSSLMAQQLSELNSQLTVAKTQRAEAQARAQTIREMIRSGGDLGTSTDVVNSPLIQKLLEQQVTLQRRIAELTPTLLPQHPRMRELKAELSDLRKQILGEAGKIAQGLENEARVAGARENAIRSSLNSLKQDAEVASENEVELRALEREARAQRELLESFLVRYREASARDTEQATPATARIVSRATISNEPSFPLIGPTLAIVALATLVISIGILTSIEIFNAMHAVPPQAWAGTGPAVVRAPDMRAVPADRVEPVAGRPRTQTPVPWTPPAKAMAAGKVPDSVREIAEQLIARKGEGGKIRVLVTSPQRQTRDNSAAINIARATAARGARAILIDANIRTPRLAGQVGLLPMGAGFAEMLSGKARFAEAIHRDPASPLHLIAAGAAQFDPVPLMEAERMERVFDALEGTYGMILIDAPPVMLSPETRALVAHVDAVVVVGDDLPGAQRLVEKACEIVRSEGQFPADIIVSKPEVALPPGPATSGPQRDVA